MERIEVRRAGGDRYTVGIRGHEVTVDQPVADGGTDVGPTPTELWLAGLASCVAFYGGRFLARHDIDPDGFGVSCAWTMAEDRPARVTSVELRVHLPVGFPGTKRDRFMAVVDHCTVHNSMVRTPRVLIEAAVAVGG
jgi:putative redox protein